MEALLGIDEVSDVTFIVGDPEKITPVRIRAVSALLVAASEAFKTMFVGNFPRPTDVEVPDGDPDAFRIMLKYIYTRRLNVDLEHGIAVMYLAKKYMLDRLVEEASSQLSSQVTADNVCLVLPFSQFMDEISARCWEIVDGSTSNVLKSESFQACSHEVVCQILSRDTLNASEIEIFRSIVLWAEKVLERNGEDVSPPNIRSTLGDALDLVRFAQMDIADFGDSVVTSEVLAPEKVNDVLIWFAIGKRAEWFKATRKAMKPAYFPMFFSLVDFKHFASAEVGETRFGPSRVYDGFDWNLTAVLKPAGRLGVFLQCSGDGSSDAWTYKAQVNLRIVNYRLPKSDVIARMEEHTFAKEALSSGFSNFANINDLLDESRGFLKNNTLLLSADIFPQ